MIIQLNVIKRAITHLLYKLFAAESVLDQLSKKQEEVEKKNNLLLEKRGEFKNLMDNFPDGVLIHRDGIILYTNPKMREYLKYERSFEMLGHSIYDLIVPPEHVELIKERSQKLDSGTVTVNPLIEFELLTKIPGERFSCEGTSVPMTIDGDKCIAVTFRDLSDRKKLQMHKMATDRMLALGNLAAGVGHEINNPLCYVMMNMELVKENLTNGKMKECEKQLDVIQKGLVRIKTVVSDLKTVSRGSADEVITKVDVNGVIDSILGIVKNEIQHRAVLKCSLASVETILIDETRLAQVLLNVIINAAHSIDAGAVDQNLIEVKTFMNSLGQVVIEISDTGSGMSLEVQKKIFEPFFTTKAVGKGTGLGLSICQNIVNRFHGIIEFKSEIGQGTVFQVIFPAADAAVVPNRFEKDEMTAGIANKGQVLIIDDDAELLEVLQEIVSIKHECVGFTNAQTAIEVLKENNAFDVIVCDLMMPKMSGIQFYAALKQFAPHYLSRVIFLTGGSFTEDTDRFLAMPEITFFEKPIDTKLFLKAIETQVSQNSWENPVPKTTLLNSPLKKTG